MSACFVIGPERLVALGCEVRDRLLGPQTRPQFVGIPRTRVALGVDQIEYVDIGGHRGFGSRGRPSRRSPMMLCWISLVPPMIDVARDVSNPSAHRPSSIASLSPGISRASGPRRVDRRVVEPLAHARPEQLHDARFGTERLAAGQAGTRARVEQAEDLDLDPRLHEPLPHVRVAEEAPGRTRVGQLTHRHLVQHLFLPHERRAALVGQRRARHAPALVLGADEVLDRDLDVVEKDLVELASCR